MIPQSVFLSQAILGQEHSCEMQVCLSSAVRCRCIHVCVKRQAPPSVCWCPAGPRRRWGGSSAAGVAGCGSWGGPHQGGCRGAGGWGRRTPCHWHVEKSCDLFTLCQGACFTSYNG